MKVNIKVLTIHIEKNFSDVHSLVVLCLKSCLGPVSRMVLSDLHCSLGLCPLPCCFWIDPGARFIPSPRLGLLPAPCSACYVHSCKTACWLARTVPVLEHPCSFLLCGAALLLVLPDTTTPSSTPYPLNAPAHFLVFTVGKEVW